MTQKQNGQNGKHGGGEDVVEVGVGVGVGVGVALWLVDVGAADGLGRLAAALPKMLPI